MNLNLDQQSLASEIEKYLRFHEARINEVCDKLQSSLKHERKLKHQNRSMSQANTQIRQERTEMESLFF